MAVIPLGPASQWHEFAYRNITPNKVNYGDNQITLNVKSSASPLLHVFDKPTSLDNFYASATVQSKDELSFQIANQGARGADDAILRIGFVLAGSQRLSWWQRQLAPQWVLKMEKLLPAGAGVGKIHFYSTCRNPKLLNKARIHFLDSNIHEKCVTLLKTKGTFELHAKDMGLKNVLALWIAGDSDDLKETFQVSVEEIKINYK